MKPPPKCTSRFVRMTASNSRLLPMPLLTYRIEIPENTIVAMDGELVRTSPDHWRGTLNGYTVKVFRIKGQWNYSISTPRGYTMICTSAASVKEAGQRARKWIEANPL